MSGRIRESWARLRAMFRRREMDHELDDELAAHVEMLAEDNRARGMNPQEARRQALARVGGLDAARELHREARSLPFLDTFFQDLRYGARNLRRNPGFSAVAVLILALGIGANTAVFSLVNAILIRPLPFHEPDRLVWIINHYQGSEGAGLSGRTSRVAVMEEWQARNRSLEGLTAYHAFFGYGSHKLTGDGDPERLVGVPIAQNFLSLLGVQPHIGRSFLAEECAPGGPGAVMLSYQLWQRRFAGDPQVLGQSVTLNDQPASVVGILPPSFDLGSIFSPGFEIDLYVPLLYDEARNQGNTLAVIGRLKPGATVESAHADLREVNQQILKERPELGTWFGSQVTPLTSYVSGPTRRPLLVLWGAVGVVLLIVCVNLSNLLLARSAARRKEIAVRLALGAGPGRIVRQLVTENLLLSVSGAALGLMFAVAATRFVVGTQGLSLPLLERVGIDATVLLFTAGLAILAGLVCGIAPGLQVTQASLSEALKESSRGSEGTRRQSWVRSGLVVCEVALACVLLVGAGLLLRSFVRVLDVKMGFQPAQAVTLTIQPGAGHSTPQQRRAFYAQVMEQINTVPGIEAFGLTDTLPLDRNRTWSVRAKGVVYPTGRAPSAYIRRVAGDYLPAMGIPLIAGRGFSGADVDGKEIVILVNETGARTLWPGRNAVGEQLMIGSTEVRVVGVVGDVRHSSLEEGAGIEVYLPVLQSTPGALDLVMRSRLPASAFGPGVRAALWELDPTLPAGDFRPLEFLVDRAVSPRRFFVSLLAGFALLALTLASLGIYGVISYAVTRRTREIGIRMALGASPGAVRMQVVRESLRHAALGMVIGVVAALPLTQLLGSLLFGVTPEDPLTYFVVTLLLGAVALTAGYLPARRASSINPAQALRAE